MIFYLINAGNGQPSQLAATQEDARSVAKDRGFGPRAFEKHDVPTDKDGLMSYINGLMRVEPELTDDEIRQSNTPEAQAVARERMRPSYVDQSVALDEAWEALPLARKLHFAALAMEDARNQL